jgi:hypothetical protein
MSDTYLEQKYDISHKCEGCSKTAACPQKLITPSIYQNLAKSVRETADNDELKETLLRFVDYSKAAEKTDWRREDLTYKPKFDDAFNSIEKDLCKKLITTVKKTKVQEELRGALLDFVKYYNQIKKFKAVYHCIDKGHHAYLDVMKNLYSMVDLGNSDMEYLPNIDEINLNKICSVNLSLERLQNMDKVNKVCLAPLNELAGWIHNDCIPLSEEKMRMFEEDLISSNNGVSGLEMLFELSSEEAASMGQLARQS